MTIIRTIIADDEPKARRRIQRMLKDHDEFEVIDICGDGKETLKAVKTLAPDLIFLDIQMPGYDGFELLEKLGDAPTPLPKIVFITAYDEFALQAFEVHAIDYLMKPFDRKRFDAALEKVRNALHASSQDNIEHSIKKLLDTVRRHQAGNNKIMIKEDRKFVLLNLLDIKWIEASGNYVKIVTKDGQHLIRETMKNLEDKLNSDIFFRIHRSTIVNVKKIKVIEPWFHGDYQVTLIDGTQFKMSRKYTQLFEVF